MEQARTRRRNGIALAGAATVLLLLSVVLGSAEVPPSALVRLPIVLAGLVLATAAVARAWAVPIRSSAAADRDGAA